MKYQVQRQHDSEGRMYTYLKPRIFDMKEVGNKVLMLLGVVAYAIFIIVFFRVIA